MTEPGDGLAFLSESVYELYNDDAMKNFVYHLSLTLDNYSGLQHKPDEMTTRDWEAYCTDQGLP